MKSMIFNTTKNLIRGAKSPVLNAITSLSREALLGGDSESDDRMERIWCDSGYPGYITIEDYYLMWRRNGIAKRVVEAYPEACWEQPPKVFETETPDEETAFEKAYQLLNKRVALSGVLENADKLCGIGQFGIVFVGIDDGEDLGEPVAGFDDDILSDLPGGSSSHKVTFMQAYSERHVTVLETDQDTDSPRFGLPKYYGIDMATGVDHTQPATTATGEPASIVQHERVHWHRVIHVTDPGIESALISPSRLEAVWNDLIDMAKILAGNGEGYWQAAYPGISFELQDGYDSVDTDSLRSQLVGFQKGFRRFLTTVGIKANVLQPLIPDPKEHFEVSLSSISIATGIPQRILMGSEAGQLAGSQDGSSWADTVYGRRIGFCTTGLLNPALKHLQRMGCLPEGDFKSTWANPHTVTETEKAEIAVKVTEAISKYMMSGAEQALGFGDFLHYVVGFDKDRVAEIVSKLEGGNGEPGSITQMMDDRQLRREEESAKLGEKYKPDPVEVQTKSTTSGQKAGVDQRGAGSNAPQVPNERR